MQPQKWQNDLGSFPKQVIEHYVIQAYDTTTDAEETEVDQFYEDVLFIIGAWNAKVGSQQMPGITVKYCLGV